MTVELWPFPYQLALSLYAVILLAVLLGCHRRGHRPVAGGRRQRRELRRLRRQVRDMEQSRARRQMTVSQK